MDAKIDKLVDKSNDNTKKVGEDLWKHEKELIRVRENIKHATHSITGIDNRVSEVGTEVARHQVYMDLQDVELSGVKQSVFKVETKLSSLQLLTAALQ